MNGSLGTGTLRKARRASTRLTRPCMSCWTARRAKNKREKASHVSVKPWVQKSRTHQFIVLHRPRAPKFGKPPALALKRPAFHLLIRHKMQRAVTDAHGLSACVSGTILAHPGVTVTGGVAVVVGKWLRSALVSATARTAARAQASGQVA